MSALPEPGLDRLVRVLTALEEELDWTSLGGHYCHEGGEHFFPEEQRAAIRDAGLAVATDLAPLLQPGGASHYLGAALAELAPIFFETLVLERAVHWTLLEDAEYEELWRATQLVARGEGCELPLPEPAGSTPAPPVDHLWCTSVLTDPIVFPALHDELYQRRREGDALPPGELARNRRAAEELVAHGLAPLHPPAWISTSDEELPFFERACAARGWSLAVPDRGRLTGIVGDVLRHCAVRTARR